MSESSTIVALSSGALSAEVSTTGAELQTLVDAGGRSLLWNGDPAVWAGRAPILFPIIGMLNHGRYRYRGRTYALPKHGVARHARFDVVAHDDRSAVLRLDADEGTRAVYPFEFRLDIAFVLSGESLRLAATIANRGDAPMPASFGFHPAFRWPLPYGAPRAAHRLRFPGDEPAPIRRIDGDGLLLPDATPTPVVDDVLALRDDLFTADALIFDRLTSREVRYGAASGPQLHVAFDDFTTLGVWTKPGAGYVCIEPWQGIADPVGFDGELGDKPGMFVVEPGGTRTFSMTISLQHDG